jgi:hypothetical protein
MKKYMHIQTDVEAGERQLWRFAEVVLGVSPQELIRRGVRAYLRLNGFYELYERCKLDEIQSSIINKPDHE